MGDGVLPIRDFLREKKSKNLIQQGF